MSYRHLKLVTLLPLILLLAISTWAQGNDTRLIPPDAKSHNYAALQAQWWEWALSFPMTSTPVMDETGALAGLGQKGPVWFLAGTFSGPSAERWIDVPVDRQLFFPIVNTVWVSFPTDVADADCVKRDYYCWRDPLTEWLDTFTVSAEIDGVPVSDLERYRTRSIVFYHFMAEGNMFGIPADVYGPSMDEGYYLLLKPLAPGPHTIHFNGDNGSFSVDVLYHITVKPTP